MANTVRIESDSMGQVEVPADRYYGAQTQRSRDNFRIGGEHFTREVIAALGVIKKAAALVNEELGSLDRITAWGRVMGMVNSAPGFKQQTPVIDAFSELINEVFPAEIAAHSRAAVGMAELPMGLPVEIEAEVYFE